MKNKLTERQQEIYEFIRATLAERGIPPSMREVGEKFGIRSTNGVEGHLSALERNGLIVRERGKSRGISLKAGERPAAAIPLIGRVAAGMPYCRRKTVKGRSWWTSLSSLSGAAKISSLLKLRERAW